MNKIMTHAKHPSFSLIVLFISFSTLVSAVCNSGYHSLFQHKPEKSMKEKEIVTFIFRVEDNGGLPGEASGTLNGSVISIIVPFNTNISNLKPYIEITGKSVSPGSGTIVDFSRGPVKYTVIAADTTTKDYTVTVDNTRSSSKDIILFRFLDADNVELSADATGSITGTDIYVMVPFYTDITALKPDITITGASVSPASGADIDFSPGPVTYTVTAADTTTKDYTVIVDNTRSNNKDITLFRFLYADNVELSADATGDITGTDIYVIVPFYTDMTALNPDITITGTSISPASGADNDFSSGPVTYTVTAEDFTTKDYTVTVNNRDLSNVTALFTFSGNFYDEGPFNIPMAQSSPNPVLDLNRDGNPDSSYRFTPDQYFYNYDNPSPLGIEYALTVSVWVKLTDPSLDQKIVGRTYKNGVSDLWGWVLGVGNGPLLYTEVWDSTSTRYSFSSGIISSGVWTHLAITWKTGGKFRGYINGTKVNEINASVNPIGNVAGSQFRIGTRPHWTDSFSVDGNIDDIRIYDWEMNGTEIQTLYNLPAD